jgi:tRNA-binding EMAP/Myf-like protein
MQYDRLFNTESPGSVTDDILDDVNPDSIKILSGAVCEPSILSTCSAHLAASKDSSSLHFQFERLGYYALDKDSKSDKLIFNRVVTLKDAWSAGGGGEKKGGGSGERRRGNNAGGSKGGGEVAPDFARVRITTGRIIAAEPHPESEKLLVTKVDCGEDKPRTIVAGLAGHHSPSSLVGVGVLFCSNLKVSRVVGTESNGMLLGVSKEVSETGCNMNTASTI